MTPKACLEAVSLQNALSTWPQLSPTQLTYLPLIGKSLRHRESGLAQSDLLLRGRCRIRTQIPGCIPGPTQHHTRQPILGSETWGARKPGGLWLKQTLVIHFLRSGSPKTQANPAFAMSTPHCASLGIPTVLENVTVFWDYILWKTPKGEPLQYADNKACNVFFY